MSSSLVAGQGASSSFDANSSVQYIWVVFLGVVVFGVAKLAMVCDSNNFYPRKFRLFALKCCNSVPWRTGGRSGGL